MKKDNTNTAKNSSSQVLIIMALIAVIVYLVLRVVFTGYASYTWGDKIVAFILLFSEAFVMLHSAAYFLGLLRLSISKNTGSDTVELAEFPSVDILIPARHEPKEILQDTVIACYNLPYPNKIIHILDDSSLQQYHDEAAQIAEKYDCKLFTRQSRHGAKAGVINDCLRTCTGKYIAVFDVDQNPMPGFLARTVSVLEADNELALVQTPQYYSNLNSSKTAMAANMQQAIFYENICESKSLNGSMMCCGTNVVIRRSALDDVGGFDESTVTEDFATSLLLHLKGWKTIYYNHIGTFGKGPENLGAYLAQQSRWASGGVAVLKKVIFNLLKAPLSLRPIQWWEYVITSTYYLSGWCFFFLMLCPITYLLFGVPTFFMNPIVYTLAFVPYFLLSIHLFYTGLRLRNYNYINLMKGQALFFVALPVYMTSTLYGLLGIKRGFKITAKHKTQSTSYLKLWPQIIIWLICLLTITWGVNMLVYAFSAAVAVNMMWIIFYFVLTTSLFYFNEE